MKESWFQGVIKLVQESLTLWQQKQAPLLSAALAFYMVLSLSPLLLLSVSIVSIFYGAEAASGQLTLRTEDFLGKEAAAVIQQILATSSPQSTSLLTSLISAGILLFGASLVFRQLKIVLNMIWGVMPKPETRFLSILIQIRTYFFSLITALSIGLLLLFSLTFSTILAAIDRQMLAQWPELANLLNRVELLILWLLPAVLFVVIFKFLPEAKIAWRDVWLGALVTTVLFGVGARLVALYLRYSTVTSLQGAAGTVIVILLWLYYSAQIFLMGAAFTRSYAARYGSKIVPEN